MGIVISIQQRLARLQAQSKATQQTADQSQAVSNIAFVTMAEAGTIDDVTATEHIDVFATWQPGTYVAVNVLRRYGDGEHTQLYRCLQAHTTQLGWEPDVTPALWRIAGNPAEEWPEWSQPVGAVDAYDLGAKVTHDGYCWVSTAANNVWEPGVYGWVMEG